MDSEGSCSFTLEDGEGVRGFEGLRWDGVFDVGEGRKEGRKLGKKKRQGEERLVHVQGQTSVRSDHLLGGTSIFKKGAS